MALTKDALKNLFANYPNINQNTVREFVDLIFTLAPFPAGALLLSGGTMTGAIDMNGNGILNALFSAPKLESGSTFQNQAGSVILNFGTTANPLISLLQGTRGFVSGTGVVGQENNTGIFNTLGMVAIGDQFNPIPTGRYLWFQTLGVDLFHSGLVNINAGGNVNIGANAGAANITFTCNAANFTNTLLGFFNQPAVVRQAALTPADANVIPGGGAAVLTTNDKDVIDNMRTRINELETKLQAYALLQ